jgi:hypothetical protein
MADFTEARLKALGTKTERRETRARHRRGHGDRHVRGHRQQKTDADRPYGHRVSEGRARDATLLRATTGSSPYASVFLEKKPFGRAAERYCSYRIAIKRRFE